jgi:hypothetical protein
MRLSNSVLHLHISSKNDALAQSENHSYSFLEVNSQIAFHT